MFAGICYTVQSVRSRSLLWCTIIVFERLKFRSDPRQEEVKTKRGGGSAQEVLAASLESFARRRRTSRAALSRAGAPRAGHEEHVTAGTRASEGAATWPPDELAGAPLTDSIFQLPEQTCGGCQHHALPWRLRPRLTSFL